MTFPSQGNEYRRDHVRYIDNGDPAMNAFCRSFLYALKNRNSIMANLACRAFLIRFVRHKEN